MHYSAVLTGTCCQRVYALQCSAHKYVLSEGLCITVQCSQVRAVRGFMHYSAVLFELFTYVQGTLLPPRIQVKFFVT